MIILVLSGCDFDADQVLLEKRQILPLQQRARSQLICLELTTFSSRPVIYWSEYFIDSLQADLKVRDREMPKRLL